MHGTVFSSVHKTEPVYTRTYDLQVQEPVGVRVSRRIKCTPKTTKASSIEQPAPPSTSAIGRLTTSDSCNICRHGNRDHVTARNMTRARTSTLTERRRNYRLTADAIRRQYTQTVTHATLNTESREKHTSITNN